MTTEGVEEKQTSFPSAVRFGLIAAMFAFPVVIGAGVGSDNPLVSMLSTPVAFLIAIYLYYGVALANLAGRTIWLGVGAVGGALLGAVAGGSENLWVTQVGWLAILVPGLVVGRLTSEGRSGFRIFLGGLIALMILGTAALLPTWIMMHSMGDKVGAEMIKTLLSAPELQRYSPEEISEAKDALQVVIRLWFRLVPACMIILGMTLFSLGFFWLNWRLGRGEQGGGLVRRFTEWKMPFGITPLLGLVIVARLLGNDAIGVVADNLLLVMAVLYAVCGLSFMEHTLHRVKVSLFIRILFYLLLTFTHLAGLLMTVLMGFVDSFLDWRRLDGNVTVEQ